ncbi:hypothetical protein CALCODRAFT_480656 [Calocera cornea HHB12733]|uniref:Uncharacterized protein n=1 Tax=Calocera cornea HHB12733 TaxID=1353952 RepID=A0A165IHF2_9BASI|nr:hypothetical protein CALCODRAFT_480656 [Calocera cornea HHB12733]
MSQALDTLPCIKIIAGIAATILQVVQDVHTNKEDCQRLCRHAEKIVVSLARAQHDQGVDEDADLKEDLEEVTTYGSAAVI